MEISWIPALEAIRLYTQVISQARLEADTKGDDYGVEFFSAELSTATYTHNYLQNHGPILGQVDLNILPPLYAEAGCNDEESVRRTNHRIQQLLIAGEDVRVAYEKEVVAAPRRAPPSAN